jgi:hypothetical protein
MQQMTERRYNGWANYPTWAVNLWLSNDEGLYMEAQHLVGPASEAGDEAATIRLADHIERMVRDMAELDEASFRSDLLGFALDQVDWREIAADLIDES